MSILENAFDIAPHEEPMDERATARAIAHLIEAERSAIPFLEGMRVMPQVIRAAQLNVHELVRRIPLGDFRASTDGNTVNGDAVIDQGASTQNDRRRREYLKLQPGWR